MICHCRLYSLFFLLLIIANINSSTVSKEQQPNSIRLEAPHLGGKQHDSRPPIKPLIDLQKPKKKFRTKINKDSLNSCNNLNRKTNGTTCGLQEIMIGRCYEYQYVKRGLFLSNTSETKNCTELYRTFEAAVRYKSHCNINMSTYAEYFERALSGVHVIDRAMFWSGTYVIAHAYSGHGLNYITLEDTLAATMVNGLVWCGKENDTDGFDFDTCPNVCKDNRWADLAFWGLASKSFAQLVVGEIYVVLNGSNTDGRAAFRNTSYFSSFELPNFRQTGEFRVTKVNVLILHSPDHKVVEKCGEKSVLLLEGLIRKSGFDYACEDDPEELILIMCGDQWDARECQIARRVLRQAWDTKLHGISNSSQNSLSVVSLIFLCLFKSLF